MNAMKCRLLIVVEDHAHGHARYSSKGGDITHALALHFVLITANAKDFLLLRHFRRSNDELNRRLTDLTKLRILDHFFSFHFSAGSSVTECQSVIAGLAAHFHLFVNVQPKGSRLRHFSEVKLVGE